ncbi:hypothetical protein PFBG_01717 [Plasmodium falciparum 7G8]|uniref:Erythrocyte membrane protein 1 n=3 Tax=Plasmodium falciparum TaxID=5833 RepID=W7F4D8_PLAF8|nr:hypothetical protein PFBG_01717 [Plasmodium falciparum 7G8]
MAPQNGGGSSGEEDAKHVLDGIGQQVHEQVKSESNGFKDELKGDLNTANGYNSETRGTTDTCRLVEQYYKRVNKGGDARGKRYPCTNLKGNPNEERFSDTLGGQCTNKKMRSDGIGACAPYRRLHLCSHNLETIETTSTTTNKLLLEVCMAAKYEGESLTRYHRKYQYKYGNSPYQLCTVLARSFADIGDIVRGKDLFYGNPQEKEKRDELETNLKKIFKEIYDDVTRTATSGKKGQKSAKDRYKDTKNYYQLREDWWEANRETVWNAITCGVTDGDKYFRDTCSTGGNYEKCHCIGGDVLTNFDYVPQFLRWFEEWAEDFCRLRKRKLENAKNKCRKKHKGGKELYCDLNRYDCEKTIRGDHDFVEDEDCKDCQYSCSHFVNWIDNQKLEFLKQREKYTSEIKKYTNGTTNSKRKKPGAGKSNYDRYESKFYDKFKTGYNNVDSFLEKLNKETTCTNINDTEGGKIDFRQVNSGSAKNSDGNNKTFYRTKYCEACPWCGAEQESNGGWKPKNDNVCKPGNDYTNYKETKIPILTGYKGQLDIVQKYKKFCDAKGENGAPATAPGTATSGDNSDNATTGYCGTNNSDSSLCEKWTCYYKKNEKDGGKKDINFCVLQDGKQEEKDKTFSSYNAFFWDWVHDMLIDSIKWRNELGSCINNAKSQNCKNKQCRKNCDCFAKWVVKKKEEWGKIKDHFDTQEDIKEQTKVDPGVTLAALLEEEELLEIIEGTYGKSKETEGIREMLKETGAIAGGGVAAGGIYGAGSDKCTEGANGKHNTKIDKFLREEERFAETCKKTQDNCPKKLTKVKNPCSGDKSGSSNTYTAVAEKVAETLQGEANKNMVQRSGKVGESETDQKVSLLKGDASQGTYKKNGNPSDLKGDNICNINTSHSNATGESNNPCNGKDVNNKRFDIGTDWKGEGQVSKSYKDVFLPPRREHMCTSNLENLNVSWVTEDGKASHSLLGDVLLAANKQAEDIKKKYQENKHNNGQNGKNAKNGLTDKKTVCRAMKYSFADLGDIIKGTDLWVANNGENDTQRKLEQIFGKIKDELGNKYKGDTNSTTTNTKYLQLRSDWWEANRDQIWKAMQCPTKNGTFPCSGVSGVPFDDYIPQRLRWMKEWAEWYCKAQAEAYGELLMDCGSCKIKGQCTGGNGECEKCKEACTSYANFINTWKPQWVPMQIQYALSYLHAKKDSPGMALFGTGPDYKQVVDFFKELQKEYENATRSSSTTKVSSTATTITPYSSAEGYIHQEARTGECLVQNVFCNNNGNNEYAFSLTPHEYKDACKCNENKASSPEDLTRSAKPPDDADGGEEDLEESEGSEDEASDNADEEEEAAAAEEDEEEEDDKVCGMVKSLIGTNDGKQPIENCNPKEYNNQAYPEWECVKNSKLVSGDGECMPPRRIKLCLYYLKELSNDAKEYDLRKAFIKTAAAETFLSWSYYKNKNGNGKDLDEQLKKGTIPPEFLRSMFYTYGDYRDICLDTDISKKEGDVKKAKENIDAYFKKNPDPVPKKWWTDNAKHIWEAMLCSLEKISGNNTIKNNNTYSLVKFSGDNSPTLEDFAKRPQFLRWMTEWGDDFCREQKKQLETLKGKCGECYGTTCRRECDECKKQCDLYREFIKKWKGYYTSQSKKYSAVKDTFPYSSDTDVKSAEDARNYLDKQLQKSCNRGTMCDCMNKKSTSNGNNMPASLDDVPEGYEGRCDCTKALPPSKLPEVPETLPSACEIVETLFNDKNKIFFDEACNLKYKGGKEKHTQWKCIIDTTPSQPSSNTPATSPTSTSTSTCIPPRRQKMYIGKLQNFSGKTSHELRKAFVESAAVETFFLWDRYKKIKNKEIEEKRKQQNGGLLDLGDDKDKKDPQKKLEQGEIPEDFKRQMFYTLGDYRDILFGNNTDILEAVTIGSNNKTGQEIMKAIQDKIKEILNGDNKKTADGGPPKTDSGTTPQTLWSKYAEPIWNGMICALTYKESGTAADGKKIEKDEQVYKKFFGSTPGKPANPGPQNGTYENKYKYETVELKEEVNGAKTNDDTLNNPKLSDFVEIPPFFRWLHEWGNSFCFERAKRLAQIKHECKVEENGGGSRGGVIKRQYSGDGEYCEDIFNNEYNVLQDLSWSCAKPCSSYRKWIERKKIEFTQQSNAFTEQKKNYVNGSNKGGVNGFSETLQKFTTAAEFLKTLKNGPCKNNSEEGNGKDKLDFSKPNETFVPAANCAPCSKFTAKLEKCNCTGASKANTCNGGRINAENIIDDKNGNENIVMIVSDNGVTQFEGGLKDACEHANIFKGIKENKYKCGEYCGLHVCGLKKGDNNGELDDKQIILVRALIKRWLEFFIDDYNRIRKKLMPCIENGEANICINDCEKKCKCVKNWIDQKKDEWKKIKERFLEQYKNEDEYYPVRSFLETFLVQIGAAKEKENIIKLSKFDGSKGCCVEAHSQKKDSNEKDAIDCMLNKLKDKIDDCNKNQAQNSVETQAQTCENSAHVEDDDEPFEEENPVTQPNICPTTQQDEEKEEGGCVPVTPEPEAPAEPAAGGGKATEELPSAPEKKDPAPPPPKKPPKSTKKPRIQRPNPWEHPIVIPSLATSTLMWTVGIGFATFTYFFLKKKTKSSVGNLFQILQIPKSDYDITTKLSPNRYIPYTSGKYRGKRYIYLEGDSGTDSGYTDHYSDITSSSESEYEELDINDIYVPGSPKYKTLIEVVLEPSGNNTTASGKNTPSDTQNDIQNDGIPSNKFSDNEWNQLKHDFISQYLQSEQPNDVPNDYTSGNSSTNTNITTTSRHNVEEKPFITSIHDRNLLSGEEYNYDMSNNSGIYPSSSNRDSLSGTKVPYSGIDLINDTLSGNQHIDIYDELLKRKENELFGTNHPKHTNTHNVTKPARDDPLHNQLDLFHTWLDRHRNMCEKLKNDNERLAKLKEEWENETHSGNTHPSDSNKTLNTDVSIQIHMDNPKPKNEFKNMDTTPNKSTMDTILDDLEKYNEPYYYDFYKNDIYYDVNDDDKTSMDNNNNLVDKNNPVDSNNSTYNHRNPADINKTFVDINNHNQHPIEKPTKIQIEMNSNNREVVEQQYPIADIWNI